MPRKQMIVAARLVNAFCQIELGDDLLFIGCERATTETDEFGVAMQQRQGMEQDREILVTVAPPNKEEKGAFAINRGRSVGKAACAMWDNDRSIGETR
ncbi:hypothetical protein SPDO_30750 [Sphingomonas dokdonensis]|uniref:Uncharacterized protein n=1 Tax=Sphingomonas dokdonensis TaxID=344880 RepID=A0A2D0A4Y5_9SPHN|nr:hypothetical protein SPDO_30750 [Sphingomonas dokdonensis]